MTTAEISQPIVTCFCDTDLVHSADAVTGLIELADAGEIALRFRLRDPQVSRPRGMWAVWLRVSAGRALDQGICIDFHDAPEYYCPNGLAACRLYFKVNLRRESFDAVPLEHREKLRPFGPYLPCRPHRDRALSLRWLGNAFTKLRHLSFVSTKKRSRSEKLRIACRELRRHKRYLSRKTWLEFAAPINQPAHDAPAIVFNPTCWDECEGDEIRLMNEKRARLILALRREFGDRFIGGFRNDGPSVAKYHEAIESQTLPSDAYLELLHASPVAIYLNGKWGCFSWRLTENLAAGKCIVSEKLVNDAGFPLDESAGIVQCDTVDDMVTTLKSLLESPRRVRELSENSRRTYLERLCPPTRMKRLLDDALKPRGAGAIR